MNFKVGKAFKIKIIDDVHQEKYDSIDSNSESMDTAVMQIGEVNKDKDEWLYCEMCVYKCKIKKTMVKHLNTKHKSYKSCKVCGKKFITEDSLIKHKEEHGSSTPLASSQDSSFVFSESMLDEFIDKDI